MSVTAGSHNCYPDLYDGALIADCVCLTIKVFVLQSNGYEVRVLSESSACRGVMGVGVEAKRPVGNSGEATSVAEIIWISDNGGRAGGGNLKTM